MTTNFRLLAMAAVAMLAMNSCVKEENLGNGDKKGTPVEFEMGVSSVSRTITPDDGNTTIFAEGDSVGIFVFNGTTPVATNVQYKLEGEKWVAQGDPIYVEAGASYSYYAYYPYNSEATDVKSINLSVDIDQRNGYTSSDALIAKSEAVQAGATTVSLNYSHAFALVQVQLEGNLVTNDATVYLQNIQPTATINLKEGSVSAVSGDKGNVAMKFCDTNKKDAAPSSYRAIVPAQTISTGDGFLVVSLKGKNYKFKYSSEIPYESGKMRQFNVKLESKEQTVSVGTIENWGNSTDIAGTSDINQASYINYFGETLENAIAAPNFKEDTWYGLKRKADEPGNIAYAIEEDAATNWGKAAKFSFTSTWNNGKALSNSWYIGTLGYYHCSEDAPIIGGIYKISMKVKSELSQSETAEGELNLNGSSKIMITCRNADNSGSFGASTSQKFSATTVSVTPKVAGTWEDYTFFIDFSQKSSSVGSATLEASNASDYSKFDLRIYTNDNATETIQAKKSTIYISDVTIEPYLVE